MYSVTCIAPVNIALIKYWGKRNEELILPINDSISMTLSTREMSAKTTVTAAQSFKSNRMWLNNDEVSFEENSRLMRCLQGVHRLANANAPLKVPTAWKVHVASRNNFPTAAGLASSAAGYACLVYALAHLYGVPLTKELTAVARQGSGSACRSLYGGFVHWHRGALDNGSDSISEQVASPSHWPNMHVLILVVNDAHKKTPSTTGMQRSVTTSALIQHRAEIVVPQRIDEMKKAIQNRDFNKFAEITMRDSNQFHAIALDTYPPCVYMNDVSHAIVNFVHSYNEAAGSLQAAYTFDAGPNACLYALEEHIPQLLDAIQVVFPNDRVPSVEYLRGIPVSTIAATTSIKKNIADILINEVGQSKSMANAEMRPKNLLKYIIHTKVGKGPCQLSNHDSLLVDGMPAEMTTHGI